MTQSFNQIFGVRGGIRTQLEFRKGSQRVLLRALYTRLQVVTWLANKTSHRRDVLKSESVAEFGRLIDENLGGIEFLVFDCAGITFVGEEDGKEFAKHLRRLSDHPLILLNLERFVSEAEERSSLYNVVMNVLDTNPWSFSRLLSETADSEFGTESIEGSAPAQSRESYSFLPRARGGSSRPPNADAEKFLKLELSSETLTALFSEKLVDKYVSECVANCFHEEPEGYLLRSTTLWASGFFDALELIGDPVQFPWLISKFANVIANIKDEIDTDSPRSSIRLLACTHSGVAIATAVHRLLFLEDSTDFGVDVVDRFGPSQMFVEEYSANEQIAPSSYIFIGDFIIAGTEVKIAENHAYHRNTVIPYAVVIGSVLHGTTESGELSIDIAERMKIKTLVDVHEIKRSDGDDVWLAYSYPDPPTR